MSLFNIKDENDGTLYRFVNYNAESQSKKELEIKVSGSRWGMAAAQQEKAKCKGTAVAEVKSSKAEQIWPLWADFCNIQNWFPNLASCSLVEGVVGNEVGSVRYCVGEEVEGRKKMWAKERLLEMEHKKRLMRYEALENSVGLKGYVAEIRVYDKEEDGGCLVEWWFEFDTVEGWGEDGFQGYVQSSLDFIVKKMEDAVRSGLP